MGAFIGYGEVGVWLADGERDAFLDWYASNRCQRNDSRWIFCMSPGNRWTGCCIELNALIPHGEILEVTDADDAAATAALWPNARGMLLIISQITRGSWSHLVSSREAIEWRKHDVSLESVSKTN